MSVFVYVDVPIPLYAYRVQPQRPNHNATTRLYNDGTRRLSCEHPRGRLSPARHGYFAKGSAPTRMVVRGRECVHVVEDCGAMQPRNARVQDWRPKKNPPRNCAGGGGTPREGCIAAAFAAGRAPPRVCCVNQWVACTLTVRGWTQARSRSTAVRRTWACRGVPRP